MVHSFDLSGPRVRNFNGKVDEIPVALEAVADWLRESLADVYAISLNIFMDETFELFINHCGTMVNPYAPKEKPDLSRFTDGELLDELARRLPGKGS